MRRLLPLLIVLLVPSAAHAVQPSFDIRHAGAGLPVAPAVSGTVTRARVALKRSLGTEGVLRLDPLTGTPRMIAKLDGFLSAPATGRPEAIALAWARSHRSLLGIAGARLRRPRADPPRDGARRRHQPRVGADRQRRPVARHRAARRGRRPRAPGVDRRLPAPGSQPHRHHAAAVGDRRAEGPEGDAAGRRHPDPRQPRRPRRPRLAGVVARGLRARLRRHRRRAQRAAAAPGQPRAERRRREGVGLLPGRPEGWRGEGARRLRST